MGTDPIDLPSQNRPLPLVETELNGRGAGVDHADQRLRRCCVHIGVRPSAEDVIAAVDVDRVTRHRASVLACQKDARGTYLLNGHQTPGWRAFRHSLHQRVEIGNSGGGAGRQWAWADGMHTNALGPELGCQIAYRGFERRLYRAHDPVILDDLVRAM